MIFHAASDINETNFNATHYIWRESLWSETSRPCHAIVDFNSNPADDFDNFSDSAAALAAAQVFARTLCRSRLTISTIFFERSVRSRIPCQ